MAKTKNMNMIGRWAFLIGVILAIILAALGPIEGTWAVVLVVIGLLVGLLNVADEEVTPFMMSGVVLIIASALGSGVMNTVPYVGAVFDALLIIFVPATAIVTIKNVFTLAKN